MSAPKATKLGPGVLLIGDATTGQDASCKTSATKVEWDKDKEDNVNVLCGSTIAGATAYTAKLTGTIAQDLHESNGIVAWSWAHKGEQHPFLFIPNSAAGKKVTGTLTVDPLTVGGDEVKKNMMSDFEWDIVGDPLLDDAEPATGATAGVAGVAGVWTPAGSVPPGNVADLIAGVPETITADPTTPWLSDTYVQTLDSAEAHWDGTAWVANRAP